MFSKQFRPQPRWGLTRWGLTRWGLTRLGLTRQGIAGRVIALVALAAVALSTQLLPVASAVVLLTLSGCAAGRQELSGTELTDPPPRSSYYVTTRRGEELEFISLAAHADTLTGTLRTTRRRMVGAGETERVEVQNQYREMALPMSDVRRVEIDGARRKSLLYVIAGAVVAGGAYFIINRPENDPGDTGGGGRTPPTIP